MSLDASAQLIYNNIKDSWQKIEYSGISIDECRSQIKVLLTDIMIDEGFKNLNFEQQYKLMQEVLSNELTEASVFYKEKFEAIRGILDEKNLTHDAIMSQSGWKKLLDYCVDGNKPELKTFLEHHDGYQLAVGLSDIELGCMLLSYEKIFQEPFYFSRRFINRVVNFEPIITICTHGVMSLSSSDSISCMADDRHMSSTYYSIRNQVENKKIMMKADVFKLKWWEVRVIFMIVVLCFASFLPVTSRIVIALLPSALHHYQDKLDQNPGLRDILYTVVPLLSVVEESLVCLFYASAFILSDVKDALLNLGEEKRFISYILTLYTSTKDSFYNTFSEGVKPLRAQVYERWCFLRYKINESDRDSEREESPLTMRELFCGSPFKPSMFSPTK